MIRTILINIAVSVAIFFCVALGLILSQPVARFEPQEGLDFSGLLTADPFAEPQDSALFSRTTYPGAGGTPLPMTRVAGPAPDAPLIVMVHGSGWHGGQFERLAWALRDVAEVKAVTLRGHGESPERRGDVDYIGQLEDDLAAAMEDTESRKVILLGHSSGGGLVVRFAGGKHRDLIDGAVLLAPFLKHNAPTMRDNSGGWTKPLTRRIIGLSMLNGVGIRALDHLTAIQFNMPREVLDGPQGHLATLAYSWRLNTSYAPRSDYLGDVAKLPPFVLVAGRDDEAFRADQYEAVLSGASDLGRYILLDGVGHLDLVDDPATETAIREMLGEL